MPLKIFMVDDHPVILESYKNAIDGFSLDHSILSFTSIEDCYLTIFEKKNFPDVLFIDLSMPSYLKESIKDGFHFSKLLRKKFPALKILILTMHSSPLYIYSVIESVKPNAFLIKSDIDSSEIKIALNHVLEDTSYYSKSALKVLNIVNNYPFLKDEINRNILLLVSERLTTKEISDTLLLSESTIEKRKATIKQYLKLENVKDRELILHLKKLNII